MKDYKTLIRITTVPLSLYSLLKGQLKFMSKDFHVIGIASQGDLIEKIKQQEQVEIKTVEMTRVITPLKDLKAVWDLYKIFKKEKPLIVHTHTPKAGTVGMLAARLAGVPLRLHTIAGLPLLEATGNKRRLLNFVEKITYSFATMIYPNSHGLEKIILNYNFTKKDKLKVIGNGSSNGIDTRHFNSEHFTKEECLKLKRGLKIKEKDFVFIFVGRLVRDKGLNELIASFENISQSRSYCKLLLVGSLESDLDPLTSETLSQIKNNQSIISIGFQNDVRSYLAIANVLAFPSYREGFPNVVMQAGAMGLPSIVTNINGCNEIIEEGKNGTIIPPKDKHALEKAMLRMVDNPDYRISLQKNARPMICSRYEQQMVWDSLLQEYQTLIQNLPKQSQ